MLNQTVVRVLSIAACLTASFSSAANARIWEEVAALKKIGPIKDAAKEQKMRLRYFILKESLRKKRLNSIGTLVQVLRNDTLPVSARMEAARMLGYLRASRSVHALLEQITLQPLFVSDGASRNPCVDALIKIGKPSSRAVLKELQKPLKGVRRRALALVLAGVEGRKVGGFLLQGEIAAAKSAAERKNLQLALKALLAMTANEREFPVDPRRGRKPKR